MKKKLLNEETKKIYKIKLSNILTKFISSENFIKWQYKLRQGYELNLDDPKTYNEKLQWLKLNYHNPFLHDCVDKYKVREYVKNIIGEKYLIPLIGYYKEVSDINFNKLPSKFIIKLTNGSSFNLICYDKTKLDIKATIKRLKRWKKIDYYSYGREWAYKDVENNYVIEELLEPSNGKPPKDYRFYCFNGMVKYIAVDFDSVVDGKKTTSYKRNIYDSKWNKIEGTIKYPNSEEEIVVTNKMLDMIKLAEKLAKPFPHVRVDFYYFDNKIYFGELTFYHASGYQKISPKSFDLEMGKYIDLEELK